MNKHKKRLFLLRLAARRFAHRFSRKGYSRPGAIYNSKTPFYGPTGDYYQRKSGKVKKGNEQRNKPFKELFVPEVFSLIDNTDITLGFFEELNLLADREDNINVKWDKVQRVTPDSLLYILSILHKLRKKKSKIMIRANRPANKACMDLIFESGFYDFTDVKIPPSKSVSMLSIKHGKDTERLIVRSVKDFCTDKLGIERFSLKAKSIQSTLLECTTNTNNHAYKDEKESNYWWTLAHHEDSKIKITFLDNGIGIPQTIVKKLLSTQHFMPDEELIHLSFKGEIRSATRLPFRNKGLPKIFNRIKSEERLINKLTVMSDQGFLESDYNVDQVRPLNTKFKGTLLQFEIS